MPRPPKKAAEGAKGAGGNKVIDVDNFIRVRDSVYARLSTIQDLLKTFSADYLRQTNLLLGEGTNLEAVPDLNQLDAFVASAASGALAPVILAPPVEEKKERKKRTHDPNAPKRPLTPYFLYMQTARPIIASDLGEGAPKGAVQEEGQRRWAVMNAIEKSGWNQAYQYNLRLYHARVHSYKHGNPDAKEMSDDAALKYADDNNVELPAEKGVDESGGNEQDAIAEQLQQAAADAEEPSKTPKKGPKGGKRKSTATPAAVEPPTLAAAASPAQKRKRASKAAEEPEPKKSGRKKTKQ